MSKMCYPSTYTDLSSENTGRCYYTHVGSFAQELKLICKLPTVYLQKQFACFARLASRAPRLTAWVWDKRICRYKYIYTVYPE